MTHQTLPAQSPRIIIKFACPKCSKQNEVAFDVKKIECKFCYQKIVVPIFKEEIPNIQNY